MINHLQTTIPLTQTTAVVTATLWPSLNWLLFDPQHPLPLLFPHLRATFPTEHLPVPTQANALQPSALGSSGLLLSWSCPQLSLCGAAAPMAPSKEVPVSTLTTAYYSNLLGQLCFIIIFFSITTSPQFHEGKLYVTHICIPGARRPRDGIQ